MFGRMKYVLSVNKAIAELGIDPSSINAQWRQGLQEIGFSQGYTAQEVATFIGYKLPLGHRPDLFEAIVRSWVAEGKVRNALLAEARGF